MNTASPSSNKGRRILLAGILIASTPVLPSIAADGRKPSRLPAVAASSKKASTQPPSIDTKHGVEGLFASFKVKKSEARLASSTTKATKQAPAAQRWLRSSTSSTSFEVARRMIAQASNEYAVGAWASAESSAWDAMRWASEGVELASRESGEPQSMTALKNLQIARTAIREARDFRTAGDGPDAIARLIVSHDTTVLDAQPTESLSTTDAIDRYLDEARVRLSGIAARSVEAAQAMDLLAAIHLGRSDAKMLPSSTALCLRRAALQGQPQNASLASRLGMHLADLGLYEEAKWALQHSLQLEPSDEAADTLIVVLRRLGQAEEAAQLIASMQAGALATGKLGPRLPEVTELSPEDFAAISNQVVKSQPGERTAKTQLASVKTNVVTEANHQGGENESARPSEEPKKPSMMRRFLNVLKPAW